MRKSQKTNGPNIKPLRARRIAAIHIAKKQARVCTCGEISFNNNCPACKANARFLPMSDVQYQDFLFSLVNKISCSFCSDNELLIILQAFAKKGFLPAPGIANQVKHRKTGMLQNLTKLAQQVLGDGWESSLNGFCKKTFNLDSFSLLKTEQVTRCFAYLRGVQKSKDL